MTRVLLRLHHHGQDYRWADVTDRPMPTINTIGISDLGSTGPDGIMIAPTLGGPVPVVDKPPYRVPGMGEIRALEWNGFTAASTFSGCGGGCLGLEMAGYRIGWASEFIPAAADTYAANHPGVHLDTRDIRQVDPQEVLDIMGLKVGELALLEGSPPCAAFSTAGVRSAGWNQPRKYSDTVQRTDDLFGEYCRMIEGLRPAVFTAENVSGLVKGVAKGYFKEILARMKAAGYQVQARLLDASWLGVPQARQRIFFVGVREDLGMAPAYPKPLPYRYSVRDALPHILAQGANTEFGQAAWEDGSRPSGSLGADPSTGNGLSPPGHVLEVAEIITQRGPKEEPQYSAGDITDRPAPAVLERNGNYQVAGPTGVTHDPETGADITIGRYAIGKEWLRLAEGQKSGRYQQLWRPDDGRPVPTLTARAGAEGVAGVMHWAECRKLTLGELRALCGFPPDFVLTGSYKQRWERLGRAVPPVMMAHLAAAIRDQILVPLRADGRIG